MPLDQPLVTLIVGVSATIVSIAALRIAFQQKRLAEGKLRLDLFDRRFKVFDALRAFLSVIMREATFSDVHLFDFYRGTADARFLFGTDIVEYLDKIGSQAIDMRVLAREHARLPVSDEHSRLVKKEGELLKWLTAQLVESQALFGRYMSFSSIR